MGKRYRLVRLLLQTAIWTAVVFLIAYFLSYRYKANLQDVLTGVSLVFTAIGLFAYVGGNPAGLGLHTMGQQDANVQSYFTAQVTEMERKSTDFFKNFSMQNVFSLRNGKFALLASGIINFLISVYYPW